MPGMVGPRQFGQEAGFKRLALSSINKCLHDTAHFYLDDLDPCQVSASKLGRQGLRPGNAWHAFQASTGIKPVRR